MCHFILKQKKKKEKTEYFNTFIVPCEKSETVSFTTSIMKNIADCCSRFSMKLVCWIAFGSASSAHEVPGTSLKIP